MNADGSKALFVELENQNVDFLNSVDDNSYFGLQMSADDLDGNGFEDIILSDGGKVHTYYNMGDDNWQIDIISLELNVR